MSRTVRYSIVASIVLVVGGIFVWRDVLPRYTQRGAAELGVLDTSVRPVVGGKAPDFVLKEPGTGKLVKLSDFRGKPVVLNFWATWCSPCRQEMPEFQETHERRGATDVTFLGVNFRESDDAVLFFQKQLGLTFPVVLDRQGSVAQHYGVDGFPATFFIDRDGIVRAKNLGPVLGPVLLEGLRAAGVPEAAAR